MGGTIIGKEDVIGANVGGETEFDLSLSGVMLLDLKKSGDP